MRGLSPNRARCNCCTFPRRRTLCTRKYLFPFFLTNATAFSFRLGHPKAARSVRTIHYTVNGTMLWTRQGCFELVITLAEPPRGANKKVRRASAGFGNGFDQLNLALLN